MKCHRSSKATVYVFTSVCMLWACSGNLVQPPAPPPNPSEEEAPWKQPVLPFEPVSVPSYTAKVKQLITGLPPTSEEVNQVEEDPSALRPLAESWLNSPQAETKLLVFFQNAFQQKQIARLDFIEQLGDRVLIGKASLGNQMIDNARQSFARTALELMKGGSSFQETVTTRRFLMTPALMALFALIDQRALTDEGRIKDAMYLADSQWKFTVKAGSQPIPLEETLSPQSPHYLTWSAGRAFPSCSQTTRVFDAKTNGTRNSMDLFSLLLGFVGQDRANPECLSFETTAQFIPDDFTTWKWVTVRPPRNEQEPTTRFFDLKKLRDTQELVLRIPRVGFFSTPAFFAGWPTNEGNSARVLTNQTLIVALGKSFDPASNIIPIAEPGLDAEHADPTTACYGCHRTLDPMRQFFRKTYSLSGHAQNDPVAKAQSAVFTFDGVSSLGNTLDDYAQSLAQHPRFARAWTQKLCYYANSAPCAEDDPEFLRVANVFQDSRFNFKVLLAELFTSPLTTGARAVKTFEDRSQVVSIARYDHLCAALNARLQTTSACGVNTLGSSIAANLPSDSYSRGAEAPVLNADSTLFFRAGTENLCRTLAGQFVDGPQSPYSSTQKDKALDDLVSQLMGLPDADPRALPARQILLEHWNEALRQGALARDALKSTFVLACSSPSAISIGL